MIPEDKKRQSLYLQVLFGEVPEINTVYFGIILKLSNINSY
jgi:hypothetical protein